VTAEEEDSVLLSHLGKLSVVPGQKIDVIRNFCLQIWHYKWVRNIVTVKIDMCQVCEGGYI